MSELASLIDPSKRIGTVTRVTASAVELTLPNALAALVGAGWPKAPSEISCLSIATAQRSWGA